MSILLANLLEHLMGFAFIGGVILLMLILSLTLEAIERRFGWFFRWIKKGTQR